MQSISSSSIPSSHQIDQKFDAEFGLITSVI